MTEYLLSWDDIPWVLGGRRQVSKLEYLDFDKDICIPQNSSLILLPFPLKQEPHAEQMCSKLSGTVNSYSTQQDVKLNEIGCTDNTFLITVGVDGKLAGGIFGYHDFCLLKSMRKNFIKQRLLQ